MNNCIECGKSRFGWGTGRYYQYWLDDNRNNPSGLICGNCLGGLQKRLGVAGADKYLNDKLRERLAKEER